MEAVARACRPVAFSAVWHPTVQRGAQVLGKSPGEVKSAVTEMKEGSPAATPPTDLCVKNEKGSRRLWEVRAEEVLRSVKSLSLHLVSICLTFEILIIDGVCAGGGSVFIVHGNVSSHMHVQTHTHTHTHSTCLGACATPPTAVVLRHVT